MFLSSKRKLLNSFSVLNPWVQMFCCCFVLCGWTGDINLPNKVKEAMQVQVEAERMKRARVLESEGKTICQLCVYLYVSCVYIYMSAVYIYMSAVCISICQLCIYLYVSCVYLYVSCVYIYMSAVCIYIGWLCVYLYVSCVYLYRMAVCISICQLCVSI